MTETPSEIRGEDDFSEDEFGSEEDVTPDDMMEPRGVGLGAMTAWQLRPLHNELKIPGEPVV